MTKIVGSKTGIAPLAHLLRGHNQQLSNLNTRQTQYTLDSNGNALVIVGDMSNAPLAGFAGANGTSGGSGVVGPVGIMEATGLTGHGIAVYVSATGTAEPVWASGGQWVQLPTPSATPGYTEVNVSANKTLGATDADTEQNWTSASAGTITIPPDSTVLFSVGTMVRFRQTNTGTLTVSPGSGASLHYNSTTSSSVVLAQEGFVLEAVKTAPNTWVVSWATDMGLAEVNVSANKTLTLDDANTEQNWTSASAGTITIPPDSTATFQVGTFVRFRQTNTGTLTVAPGSGAQLHNGSTSSASVSLLPEGYVLEAVKVAANVWVVSWPITTGAGATVDETVANYQPVGVSTNLALPTDLAADSGHQHEGVASITAGDGSINVTSSDSLGHGAVTLQVPFAAGGGAAIQGQFVLQGAALSITQTGGAFIVPPGVTTMHVIAVGGTGGHGQAALTNGSSAGAAASGSATNSSTTTTLNTSPPVAWTLNQWVNYWVFITSGTGVGQQAQISGNTGTTLTFPAMAVAPDSTSHYDIGMPGGPGSLLEANIPITPGQTYYVNAAGIGAGIGGIGNGGGPSGGTGGGAADVRLGGNLPANRVISAAGGGGAGGGCTLTLGLGGAGGGINSGEDGQTGGSHGSGGGGGGEYIGSSPGGGAGGANSGGNTGVAGTTTGNGGNGGSGLNTNSGGGGGGGDGYAGGGGGGGGGLGGTGGGGGGGVGFLTGTATALADHPGFGSPAAGSIHINLF